MEAANLAAAELEEQEGAEAAEGNEDEGLQEQDQERQEDEQRDEEEEEEEEEQEEEGQEEEEQDSHANGHMHANGSDQPSSTSSLRLPSDKDWSHRYESLLKFGGEYGHYNVPPGREYPLPTGAMCKLGRWLSVQRKDKRGGNMDPEKLRLLQVGSNPTLLVLTLPRPSSLISPSHLPPPSHLPLTPRRT